MGVNKGLESFEKQFPTDAKISIIIPVYNDPEGLRSCLESLYALADDNYEIIVADDASEKDTARVCDPERVRIIRLARNSGPGATRNEGAAHAGGSILAFIDADCTAPPDWLARMREAFSDQRIVAVAGTYSDQHVKGVASEVRFLEAAYYHRKDRIFVNAYISANFAIRADVFRKVGGFPPIRQCAEDLLLGYKLWLSGLSILWIPDLKVGQYFRPTLSRYFRQQMNWSRGVSTIGAVYPATMALTWNVRRGVLQAQFLLQTVALLGAAWAVGLGGSWWFSAVAAGGCILLNVPFIRFVTRKKSLLSAGRCLLVVLCIRNMAHLAGVSLTTLKYPLTTLWTLRIAIGRILGERQTHGGPSIEEVDNHFPPNSDWSLITP